MVIKKSSGAQWPGLRLLKLLLCKPHVWKQLLLAVVAESIAVGIPAAHGGQPPGPPDLVTICHKPGTPAQKTLTLPRKAAEKHIAEHGDTLGACPAQHFPMLVPPTTPEESRAIRDGFSWERTLPVPEFSGQDPTLYYALIYVRDESDLEVLEDLKIHWDTVPLFAEERDQWIKQTEDTTPVFDGEGGFVFAVIPGLTFNLLREAVLCSDPQAVDEVFQVVQLREIPVSEARERDGSLSYQFLATEGFQYRGLPACDEGDPNDPETLCAPESDTLQLLLHERPNVCALVEGEGQQSVQGLGEVTQAFGLGLGKRFKRFASRVVRFVNGAKDLARRGLSRFARLFKGSVVLTVTLEARNTDPGFGGRNSIMRRTWGARRDDPVPLSGVQVRVYQNLTYRFRIGLPSVKIPGTDFRTPNIIADTGKRTFPIDGLATARANDNGIAGIRVVKNSRARICARTENEAARVVDWIFPKEACAFEVCDSASPSNCTERIEASQLGANGAFTARISNEHSNILAQATEGRAYLRDIVSERDIMGKIVGAYRPKRAEVMVGFFADVISQPDDAGDDRAFAPCFGFPNWRNPYSAVLGTLGQLGGRILGDEKIGPVLRRGADLAAEALDEFSVAAVRWAAARLAAAGTSAAGAVNAAAAAVDAAKAAALAAAQAAAAAAQAGQNVTEAAKQLNMALAQKRGAAVIDAASAALEQAVSDAHAAAVQAADAQAAAARAADDAAVLIDAAVAAAANTAAAAVALEAAAASKAAADLIQASGEVLSRGISISLQLGGRVAGELLGLVLGEVFDIALADVDLVIPSGPSRQSRGVVTHEYGHFVLCDMMYRTSPFKFGSAWTEIIADTVAKQVLKQDQSKDEHVYINEAFADFFAGQVAAGVNYFNPIDSASSPVWHDKMKWCGPRPSSTEPPRCLEDNFGAGPGPLIPGSMKPKQKSSNRDPFIDQVARVATTLHDVFDGHPNNPARDLPGNGGAWTFNGSLFDEHVTPIDSLDQPGVLHEESIALEGPGLFRTVRAWLDQEPPLAHLREAKFVSALTRVMLDADFPLSEICRLYILHQPNDFPPRLCLIE